MMINEIESKQNIIKRKGNKEERRQTENKRNKNKSTIDCN